MKQLWEVRGLYLEIWHTRITSDMFSFLGNEKKACQCGSKNCSGFLGVRPKTQVALALKEKKKEKQKKKKKKDKTQMIRKKDQIS